MFRHTWKKYLPVISILIKRSATGEQSLSMNHTDFERAAGGRKVKFTFTNLLVENGRIDYNSKHSPLAKDLVLALQENEQTRNLLQKKLFEFAMTGDFRLLIKNNTPPAEPLAEETTGEMNGNSEIEKDPSLSTETDGEKNNEET
jgi:hypothetical protein